MVDGLVLAALGIAITLIVMPDNYSFYLAMAIVASPMIVTMLYIMGKCFRRAKTLLCLRFVNQRL